MFRSIGLERSRPVSYTHLLSTCIHEHMKHGAYFITSGIIDTKEKEVAEAFKKNPELEIVEINHDGEWVNITARRK